MCCAQTSPRACRLCVAPGLLCLIFGACKLKKEVPKDAQERKDTTNEQKKVKKDKSKKIYAHVACQSSKLVKSFNDVLKLHSPTWLGTGCELCWSPARTPPG